MTNHDYENRTMKVCTADPESGLEMRDLFDKAERDGWELIAVLPARNNEHRFYFTRSMEVGRMVMAQQAAERAKVDHEIALSKATKFAKTFVGRQVRCETCNIDYEFKTPVVDRVVGTGIYRIYTPCQKCFNPTVIAHRKEGEDWKMTEYLLPEISSVKGP